LAPLTPQSHLAGALLAALQVVAGNVCERPDEGGVAIQTLCPLNSGAVGLMHDFKVEFIERLNVIAGEGNRNKDQVRLAPFNIFLDRIARLGTQPGGWSDLRLPTKSVGVRKPESSHDRVHCGSNLCRIRVTWSRQQGCQPLRIKGGD
jgi:hypothetical protein